MAVFSDNTTALAYLRRQGGTFSPRLNQVAQGVLRWAESLKITLFPQFIQGKKNVVADALSRPHQVIGSEWTLHQEVFDGGLVCKFTQSLILIRITLDNLISMKFPKTAKFFTTFATLYTKHQPFSPSHRPSIGNAACQIHSTDSQELSLTMATAR